MEIYRIELTSRFFTADGQVVPTFACKDPYSGYVQTQDGTHYRFSATTYVPETDRAIEIWRPVPHGLMWEADHLRRLDWPEYYQWQREPLPFGWSIIQKPPEPTT